MEHKKLHQSAPYLSVRSAIGMTLLIATLTLLFKAHTPPAYERSKAKKSNSLGAQLSVLTRNVTSF